MQFLRVSTFYIVLDDIYWAQYLINTPHYMIIVDLSIYLVAVMNSHLLIGFHVHYLDKNILCAAADT